MTTDSDDFGLSSGDEADLLAVAETAESQNSTSQIISKHKRQLSTPSGQPPAKAPKTLQVSTTSSMALEVATNILNTRFGMSAFRLKQALAITRVLEGGSAVVVFPTGGGKSLCYQVPGVAFKPLDRATGIRQGGGEGGITLVVSPLIALMKDQVDALKRRNIRAASMDSSKTRDEYLATVDSMREGTLEILYCAPERLNNEGFVASMANVKGGVRLLAIDEAHCISEWGHAFRPDYLKVARFAKEIQAERVLCLTATATPKVAQDVCDAFSIPKDGLFRTTTYRSNLRLQARSFMTKKESYPELISFLNKHQGSTIIYVTLQKHAEELAERIRNSGIRSRSVAVKSPGKDRGAAMQMQSRVNYHTTSILTQYSHFHAGMPTEEKTSCQDEFMKSKNMVICATIAFGMGIDKPDIRNVIHYDVPRSLEGYSQEIGRAGRDGLESYCMLYLCAEDFHLRESFARGDLPSKKCVSGLLKEIFSTKPQGTGRDAYIESSTFQQSKDFDIKTTVLKNIYAQLELRFELLRETTPKYNSYKYKLIMPTTWDTSAAAETVRKASKKAKIWYDIDIDNAARMGSTSRAAIVAKLNDWNERALIELDAKGVQNVYRVLKPLPKTDEEQQAIIDSLYKELEIREQQDLARMEQVNHLFTGRECYSEFLARHFGDTLPDGQKECGHCTWCQTHTPVELKKPPQVPWNSEAFSNVLKLVPQRDDARYLARVAFGIGSPRVSQAKLMRNPVFGSMEDHDFATLLTAFEKTCANKM